MKEIIFEVSEDDAVGGYTAHTLGYGIHILGETLEELRTMVRDAVDCYFDETMAVVLIRETMASRVAALRRCVLCSPQSN
jgi:hypothetical protein